MQLYIITTTVEVIDAAQRCTHNISRKSETFSRSLKQKTCSLALRV